MSAQVPPGVNLKDDLGGAIIRPAVAVIVVVALFVAARLASRKLKKADWNASELFVIFGFLGCLVFAALDVYDAKLGLGKHIEIVPVSRVKKIFLSVFVQEIVYTITIVCIKISILLLYKGLFPVKPFELAANLVGVFVVLWGIAVLLVAIFSCIPVQGFWDPTITPPPKCINQRNFFIGNSVPNILGDVAILCLPVKQVWQLNMSKKTKVGVSAMFLLGGFVVVASCVRMNFLLGIDDKDPTYTYYGIGLWTAIELDVATISACLPTLRPMLQYVSASFYSLYSRSSHSKLGDSRLSSRDAYYKNQRNQGIDEELHHLPNGSSVQPPGFEAQMEGRDHWYEDHTKRARSSGHFV